VSVANNFLHLILQTRMAHSSYDYMFGKPAMRFLMNDYLQVVSHRMQVCGIACRQCWSLSDAICRVLHQGTWGWLNFRPAEDQRVSVAAVLDKPDSKGLQGTGHHDASAGHVVHLRMPHIHLISHDTHCRV
jgi:hypothetical protein